MKLLKQIRTAIFIIVALTAASSAGAETRHILERGETLESVAKKYGITTEQIIALNPDAKSFTYVGMELIIPETATTRSDSAAAASTGTAATPAPVAVSSGNTRQPRRPQPLKPSPRARPMPPSPSAPYST